MIGSSAEKSSSNTLRVSGVNSSNVIVFAITSFPPTSTKIILLLLPSVNTNECPLHPILSRAQIGRTYGAVQIREEIADLVPTGARVGVRRAGFSPSDREILSC